MSSQDKVIENLTKIIEGLSNGLVSAMAKFFDWCRAQAVLPGSKLGQVIDYNLKYEATFKAVLKDSRLLLSNNLAERSIKSLVMGRKNWLSSQSFEGAKSTAIILSLLETAKLHGLDSEKYTRIFKKHFQSRSRLV